MRRTTSPGLLLASAAQAQQPPQPLSAGIALAWTPWRSSTRVAD